MLPPRSMNKCGECRRFAPSNDLWSDRVPRGATPRLLTPHFREERRWHRGTGEYTYEVIQDFFKRPNGEPFGLVSRVAADDQDRIYVFQRTDPPVVVFDRDGKYLGAWGSGEVTDPHGLKIVGDTVYTTDRSDSVAKSFTLDGKVQAGARHARQAFRHRQGQELAGRARRRAVQPPDRDAAAPQRRHLRHRRLPQRPGPPLRARTAR